MTAFYARAEFEADASAAGLACVLKAKTDKTTKKTT